MAIFTRGGDKGRTSLAGGIRVPKNHPRVEANGALDEANCFIGLLRVKLGDDHPWQPKLYKVQLSIMHTMSHIANLPESPRQSTSPKVEDGALFCESWIVEMTDEMGESHDFILPGQTEISALCHIVRSTIRRAERELSPAMLSNEIEGWIAAFINRLSDLFFTLAKFDLYKSNLPEEKVKPFRVSRIAE
jgi:ATP:cob(I)alamin adenosyltransferase